MVGKRFGRLCVLKVSRRTVKQLLWLCVCDCGTVAEARGAELRSGHKKSCGCLRDDQLKTHEDYGSREYRTYRSMCQRCFDSNCPKYYRYGGRGITITERWLGTSGYINFRNDMGSRPDGTSIDRIDNDGNYEPGNCRWATPKEQANNRG